MGRWRTMSTSSSIELCLMRREDTRAHRSGLPSARSRTRVDELFLKENEEILFSQHAYSSKSGLSYGPLEPSDFSFNHPSGMCPTCQGLGVIQEFDLDKIINPELSHCRRLLLDREFIQTVRFGNIYDNLAKIYDFDVKTPWKKLSEKAKKVFLYGTEKKWTEMRFVHPHEKIPLDGICAMARCAL